MTSQIFVNLSGFNNDLLGALWADIRNRPLWTDHLGFSQGLLFNGTIFQQISNKKDIVPETNGIRYLGTPTLRYAGVYSDVFHGVVVTPSDATLKKTSSRLPGAALPTSMLSRSLTSLGGRTGIQTPASSPNKPAGSILHSTTRAPT